MNFYRHFTNEEGNENFQISESLQNTVSINWVRWFQGSTTVICDFSFQIISLILWNCVKYYFRSFNYLAEALKFNYLNEREGKGNVWTILFAL